MKFRDLTIICLLVLKVVTNAIENMAKRSSSTDLKDNRILKILSKPHGGMNEILSIATSSIYGYLPCQMK